MKIRVLIVDDEPLARDVIRVMLEERPEIAIVRECKNGNEAAKAIREQRPDLVFLDVQMPDLDGFGVVEQIGVAAMPVVVFVTAYDQYAIQAFEVHALDYLLKPFDKERFDRALERAIRQITQQRTSEFNEKLVALLATRQTGMDENQEAKAAGPPKYLTRLVIKEAGRIFFVKTEEITWIEAAGDYVSLHLGGETHLLHQSMNGLQARLDPQRFLRVHRSTIVNTHCIKEMKPHLNGEYFIFLTDGTRLKLSRTYRDSLQSLFGQTF